jgi:methionyl-tRNA formyltransferase
MRIIFMGSPAFAIPSLDFLRKQYEICSVITQPDRPAGRGRSIRESAVKKLALSHNLPIAQPSSLRDEKILEQLSILESDLIVVAAFGQILPASILDLPKYGAINVHASLLPRWRGAAPIQAAILEGDERTGVTIMKMDPGLDTGPILSQNSVPIHRSETGGNLEERLAELGAKLLVETIPDYVIGEIVPSPQDDSAATYAPMLSKKDGQLDPAQTADRLARQVRAFEPWPTSFFFWQDLRIVVRSALPHPLESGTIGDVLEIEGLPAITTSTGSLVLKRIQPAGKRVMGAADFLNGSPEFIGANITQP